jgi:hypothetical protein
MRQAHHHLPSILSARLSRDVSQPLQAVHQFHRTVVLQLQTAGQLANSRYNAFREPLQSQEQLVLLGFHPGRPNLLFAKSQESPDLVTKLGQGAIFFQIKILHHLYRITI